MLEKERENIIRFFLSTDINESNTEFIKTYLWSENGMNEKLSTLKWDKYGKDIEMILFKIIINPTRIIKRKLKEIENYRKKEKAISIPIILENESFF